MARKNCNFCGKSLKNNWWISFQRRNFLQCAKCGRKAANKNWHIRRKAFKKIGQKSYLADGPAAVLKRRFIEWLCDQPCWDCGREFHFSSMGFDHRPGTVKCFALALGTHYSWSKLLAEIFKCDMVCACCHNFRTWSRRQP